MKKLLVLLSLAVVLSSCHGHRKNKEKEDKDEKGGKELVVPTAVKTAFTKLFAKATDAEWGLEKANEYEVEFVLDKKEMAALFDPNGNLIETETPVLASELPQAVKDSLAKEFPGYMFSETEKTDAKGVVSYEMEVVKAATIAFDAKGKLIKNEVKKDEGAKGEENKDEKGEKKSGKNEEKEEKD
jgi:hypothetical protein